MKQEHNRKMLNGYAAGALACLIVAAVVGVGFVVVHGAAEAAPTPKLSVAATTSQFSFSGAAGWRQGPANKTSMALFSNDHSCFTSVEYESGAVNVASELQKNRDDVARIGGASTLVGSVAATLRTRAGQQKYTLYQYDESDTDSTVKLLGGLGLGYVRLSDGYLKIQAHCNTVDELPATLSALQAIRFDGAGQ